VREHEVAEPILNSPYEEPQEHWWIRESEPPERRQGRRKAIYYYREPKRATDRDDVGTAIELPLANRIRERVREWRKNGYPGATRTTRELLEWWRRDGREHRLFFAQLEAVETVVFLVEARADFRQGIEVPRDEGFLRYACKMATGTGKTMVMGMIAAWSILNKVNRGDARFSDVVLVVCPNVTIRHRLAELDPNLGEASLYVKRDLVPPRLVPLLSRGRVIVTNWHAFELQQPQVGGVSGKVVKVGVRQVRRQTIVIGPKSTTARGSRYLTPEALCALVAAGRLKVLDEERDEGGALRKVTVETEEYVESDRAFVGRIIGREAGGKRNILVLNDEAHHAYRIKREEPEEGEEEEEDADEFFREATVWIEGLDRIHAERGINFCVDLSATPYFLGRVGQETNRPFPWVVSDFGLEEAIESGLVKIPQLATRDTTGASVPGYFNVWEWILPQLTPAERGGKRASPKPEAILKYAQTPITMLGGMWEEQRRRWEEAATDPRPPVFILVCKTTQLAKVIYEWLALDRPLAGIAPSKLSGFKNRDGALCTIRVDTKVVQETDTGHAKSDEAAWMRLILDTVGKVAWPDDSQGRPLYPEGFEDLATRLRRSLDPPGRDVRCIVSVGMLTEGWDCNTVTHVVGLRPFMSQLLCEQVVGRALRRVSYDPGTDGRLAEEVAQVFGVPFQIAPFKAPKQAAPRATPARNHVHALPSRVDHEIRFPRVEGYTQAIRNRIAVDWDAIARLPVDPARIPPEAEIKAALPTNLGRPSLLGPGRLEQVTLNPFRRGRREMELAFDLAAALTRMLMGQAGCAVPAHALFPQLVGIVRRYLDEKVDVVPPGDRRDLFLSPYYGWAIERLLSAIRPDPSAGEAPEVPRYESTRGPGSTADVDFWTLRDLRAVQKSHVNAVVADTARWEQQAAYFLDRDERVSSFVKNAGLGFAIPYLDNGQPHDYQPDFIARLRAERELCVILETKGFDPKKDVKCQAARRWVDAVNADGRHGAWRYEIVSRVGDIPAALSHALAVR
jgi:type III restriction enzyme